MISFTNGFELDVRIGIQEIFDFGGSNQLPDTCRAASIVAKVEGEFFELKYTSGTHSAQYDNIIMQRMPYIILIIILSREAAQEMQFVQVLEQFNQQVFIIQMQAKLQEYMAAIVAKIKEYPKIAISISALSFLLYAIRKQQYRIIYLPEIEGVPKLPSQNPKPYQNPAQFNLPNYSNIQIKTDSKIVLRGWYISSTLKSARQLLLYFHENAGNIGYRLPYIREIINKTNSDVMIVAYRGYSDSEGKPSQKGIKEDGACILKRALQEAKQRHLPLIVLGRSLGGAVAIHSCSQPQFLRQIKGVILENTFTSIHDVAMRLFGGILPKPLARLLLLMLLTNKWQSQKQICKIVAPILFIKSAMDELIPMEQMDKLEKNCMSRHESYVINNGTHNQTWSLNPNQYFAHFNKFISSL